jgi:histidine triad (HIT) family protein
MDWYCENIIEGDLEVEKVCETDLIIAFKHTKPFWEHHIVIVPKKHIESLAEPEAVDIDLIREIMHVLHDLSVEFKARGGCHIGTNVGTYQSTFKVYTID